MEFEFCIFSKKQNAFFVSVRQKCHFGIIVKLRVTGSYVNLQAFELCVAFEIKTLLCFNYFKVSFILCRTFLAHEGLEKIKYFSSLLLVD